jgi:fructoselysine-6-P-deglycase FrlB-like protein
MRVGENLTLRWESMLGGIRQQAEWLAGSPRELLAQARAALAGPAPRRIYLAGCGDSHYAGLASRYAFESWSGVPTRALPV